MNNNVVARPPGVEEVETVAPAGAPAHSPPAAGVMDKAPSTPAGRSVAGELGKMFHWLATR